MASAGATDPPGECSNARMGTPESGQVRAREKKNLEISQGSPLRLASAATTEVVPVDRRPSSVTGPRSKKSSASRKIPQPWRVRAAPKWGLKNIWGWLWREKVQTQVCWNLDADHLPKRIFVKTRHFRFCTHDQGLRLGLRHDSETSTVW